MVTGMVTSMWLAFAPKPPLQPLPTSIDSCQDVPFTNATFNQNVVGEKLVTYILTIRILSIFKLLFPEIFHGYTEYLTSTMES